MIYILLFSLLIFVPTTSCNQNDPDNRPVVLSPVLPIANAEKTPHTSVHILNAGDSRNQSCGRNSVSIHVAQPIPVSQAQYLRSLPSAVMLSKGYKACQNWDIRNYVQALAEQHIGTVVQRGAQVDNLYPWFSTNNATLCFSEYDLQKIYGMLHLYGYPRFLLTLKTMPRFHDYMPTVAAAIQSGDHDKSVSKNAKKCAQRLTDQAARERSEQVAAEKIVCEHGGIEDHDRPEAVADDFPAMPCCIQNVWKDRHLVQRIQAQCQKFSYKEYSLSAETRDYISRLNKNYTTLTQIYGTEVQHAFHRELLQIADLAARAQKHEELELFQFHQMLLSALSCNEKSLHRLTGATLDYCWAITEALLKWPHEFTNIEKCKAILSLVNKTIKTIGFTVVNICTPNGYFPIANGAERGMDNFINIFLDPKQTIDNAANLISYLGCKYYLNLGLLGATTILRGPLAGIEFAKQQSFDFRDAEIELYKKMANMSEAEFLEAFCALGSETILSLATGQIVGAALESLSAMKAMTVVQATHESGGFFNKIKGFVNNIFSSPLNPEIMALIEGADSIAIQAGIQLGAVEVIEISQSIAMAQEVASKAKGVVLASAQATAAAKAGATLAGGSASKKIPKTFSTFFDLEGAFEFIEKNKDLKVKLPYEHAAPFDSICIDEDYLKHVYAFQEKSITQQSGKITTDWTGFHHDHMKKLELSDVFNIKTTNVLPNGVYECDVLYEGKLFQGNTMFPAHWTRQQCLDKTIESLLNPTMFLTSARNQRWVTEGVTSCGVYIRTVIEESANLGKSITSYPLYM